MVALTPHQPYCYHALTVDVLEAPLLSSRKPANTQLLEFQKTMLSTSGCYEQQALHDLDSSRVNLLVHLTAESGHLTCVLCMHTASWCLAVKARRVRDCTWCKLASPACCVCGLPFALCASMCRSRRLACISNATIRRI